MWAWVCCGTLLLKNIFDFGRLMALPKSLSYIARMCFKVWLSMVLALKKKYCHQQITSGICWELLCKFCTCGWHYYLLFMDCLMRVDSPSVQRINR